MDFKIEKNIPVPPGRGQWEDLVLSMKVGDSVLIKPEQKLRATSIANAGYRIGVKMVQRKGPGGIRIWRTS